MPSTTQLFLAGAPASSAFLAALGALEVEESVEHPSGLTLEVGVARATSGDLTFVDDPELAPYATVALVAQAEGKDPECIFDGVVLGHDLHLPQGAVGARLRVSAHDSSWLMNLEEKTREWAGTSEGAVANAIFGEYGLTPDPRNTDDDSPPHDDAGRSLMQRATDIQFLRALARRSGKLCRVVSGRAPDQRTGVFAAPALDGEPVATLAISDPDRPTVPLLDFKWDVMRPTEIKARTATHDDPSEAGVLGDATDSGLVALGERPLVTYAGRPHKGLLTSAAATQAGLAQRARAVLREAGFFVRCTGAADVAELGTVLRAGTLVLVTGAGKTASGKYLVWSVRHTLRPDAHRMSFVLARNALGAPGGGGGIV